MFEKLDAIKWDALRHAHGPATDVPAAIRALTSPEERERNDALEQLAQSIFHQGSTFDSTLAAWPFLVDVVTSSKTPLETRALLLLNMGTTVFWATLEEDESADESPSGASGEEDETGIADPEQAKRVVTPEFAKLLKGIASAEPAVQLTLINLCIQNPDLGEHHASELKKLREGLEGDDPMVALLDVALALFARDAEQLNTALEALFEAVPAAADRLDEEEIPLHVAAATASEDAVVALLTEGEDEE